MRVGQGFAAAISSPALCTRNLRRGAIGHIAEASRLPILAHGTRTLTEGRLVRRTPPTSGQLNLVRALKNVRKGDILLFCLGSWASAGSQREFQAHVLGMAPGCQEKPVRKPENNEKEKNVPFSLPSSVHQSENSSSLIRTVRPSASRRRFTRPSVFGSS